MSLLDTFGFGRSPEVEAIERSPREQLAVEFDRVLNLEVTDPDHARFCSIRQDLLLYLPSNTSVPYIEGGLQENEILYSSGLGEREYYHYRKQPDGKLVRVKGDVVELLNDDETDTLLQYLSRQK